MSQEQANQFAVTFVRPSEVKGAPYNPPKRSSAVDKALDASLLELGVLEPLRVTPDMQIIDGHRRLASAKRVGLGQIPVIVEARDPEAVYAAINGLRKPLSSNDKLHVYLKSARAVDPKTRAKLAAMEKRVGRKALAEIEAKGGSLATLFQGVQVCRYINKDDKWLARVVAWLSKGNTYQARRAMEDGVPPTVLAGAIQSDSPIVSQWAVAS